MSYRSAALSLSFLCLSCGVSNDAEVSSSEEVEASAQQEARGRITCASILCAPGTVCRQVGNRARCVPQPPPANRCTTNADCRLFSDYCTGCDCRALARTQPDPVCSGPGVRCFADPCMGKVAVCQAGACTVATAPAPGPSCGNVTCPSGQVCCNASCGICTPPGYFCTQQACL